MLHRTLGLLLLSTAVVFGCAASTDDSESADAPLTGSVQDARLERIKEAYRAATVQDFTPIEGVMTDEELRGWDVNAFDAHWFTFNVDGRSLVVLDFVADPSRVLYSGPASDATEPFVMIYELREIAGADGGNSGTEAVAVLFYRPRADSWVGTFRNLPPTIHSMPASSGM